jgi:ribose-phosphate pyrophosphokinase
MERVTKKRLALYSGRTHLDLSQEIARCLDVELGEPNLVDFSNGEIRPRFAESVRGTDVFVIQSHAGSGGSSINDSIMEQLIMIDAAQRASAKRITAVCPFYGYARQDRKAEGREPITARLVADLFRAAGAKRMVSVDLHSGQIQGFFDGPVDHLTAMPVLESYLRQHAVNPVVVSPDAGRIKVAERLAQHLRADLAFIYKRRPPGTTNVAVARDVIGDVDGRQCILIDDMIDTAGTIVSAAEILKTKGATDVWAMATHGDHEHAAAPTREATRQDRGPLRRPDHRRCPQRRVRRHQRLRDLRRREPVVASPRPWGASGGPSRLPDDEPVARHAARPQRIPPALPGHGGSRAAPAWR